MRRIAAATGWRPATSFAGVLAIMSVHQVLAVTALAGALTALPAYAQEAGIGTARLTGFFGGYRFANDLAIEGSVSTVDSHQLWQADAGAGHGVGLSLAPAAPERTWNADVYTSWSFLRSFSLYGRLGYAQTHGLPAYALATLSPVDTQASRDGVNYGVGLRYDVTRALGLRLEYARFPRFAGETVAGPLPDSDQVQFGVQFQF